MPTIYAGGPDCSHPTTSRVPLDGTPFQECESCRAILDGDTLILEPIDYSMIPTSFDEYEHDHVITEAERVDGHWSISSEDGTGFGMDEAQVGEREIQAGDGIRLVTFQGARIKGVYWRKGNEGEWEKLWHYTDAEMTAKLAEERIEFQHKKAHEYARDQEKLDAAYAHLPEPFQRRIDKYRQNNPEFRASYESYEMMCCEQGVLFAETALQKVGYEWEGDHPDMAEVPDDVRKRALDWYTQWASLNTQEHDYAYQQQAEEMPGLDTGHSGNSFGMALRFGGLWLSGEIDGVVEHYGALAPLVGSDDYGDVPREAVADA